MTLTLNLSTDLEGRLRQAARQEGVAEDEFVIRTLADRLLIDRKQAVLQMLQQWHEEDETTDATEIEERRKAWEAFKAGMNANHSSGRKVYP